MWVGGCPAVMAQWQSTGGSSQRCPGMTPGDCQPFSLFLPHNIQIHLYTPVTGFVQYMYSLCRTCTCFARTHETTSCPNKSYFMLFSFIATTCQFWWLVWLCCFLDQFMQVKLLVQVPVLCCHSNYNLPAHRTSFHEIK